MSIITDSYAFNADTSLIAQYERLGRRIYRHSNNEGSVIEIDYWGRPMKLFVADSRYRAPSCAYDTVLRSHRNPQLSVTTEYFNGSSDDRTAALPYTKDDTWIQSAYPQLRNDDTAESNTNKLTAYSSTAEAAHHCRNQFIYEVGYLDLPNLYELIILYLESDNIDALDPTVSSDRNTALGMMNTFGRFNFGSGTMVWSSTEGSFNIAWYVLSDGSANFNRQDRNGGVIPVKELF